MQSFGLHVDHSHLSLSGHERRRLANNLMCRFAYADGMLDIWLRGREVICLHKALANRSRWPAAFANEVRPNPREVGRSCRFWRCVLFFLFVLSLSSLLYFYFFIRVFFLHFFHALRLFSHQCTLSTPVADSTLAMVHFHARRRIASQEPHSTTFFLRSFQSPLSESWLAGLSLSAAA